MSGHRPWRALREYLTKRRARRQSVDDARYAELVREVASRSGHKPSELADAFGGYMCECKRGSWLHLDEFGSGGGCVSGWARARRTIRIHHEFGHRHELSQVGASDLCRRYGCADSEGDT